eukprot:CAMPEP_0182880118 /NCGR_PEP_ID=MMETSP0034_2-20130328/16378_1 /TAXON_ID=156128 /ORGANISM="Nephroselmis pyriformis, Strain CCMP717" /LENGTH=79 /DNA_ID=CAMNT_0025013089 /DNA_START=311 /DNA_END=546 /DNA_ORIENTATION=-
MAREYHEPAAEVDGIEPLPREGSPRPGGLEAAVVHLTEDVVRHLLPRLELVPDGIPRARLELVELLCYGRHEVSARLPL